MVRAIIIDDKNSLFLIFKPDLITEPVCSNNEIACMFFSAFKGVSKSKTKASTARYGGLTNSVVA